MDEEAERRARLAELGPAALQSSNEALDAPADQQGQILRRLMSEPGGERFAQLISFGVDGRSGEPTAAPGDQGCRRGLSIFPKI